MSIDPLAGLKRFQRDTARHVDRMFFEEGRTRFLVADEVGLGKTLVARGVVGQALRRLEAEGVRRIDVVYISSNAEIGRQNVRRLVPPGYEVFDRLDRLTMLPLHLNDLNAGDRPNFIAFTPGTMPDGGWRTGWAQERALIYVLLAHAWNLRAGRGAIRMMMRPARDERRFRERVKEIRKRKPYGGIAERFVALVEADEGDLRNRFDSLSNVFARGRSLTHLESEGQLKLVARLRLLLARACVDALEPDLVILDEFQRFRHLFDDVSDAAMLFRAICEYADEDAGERARVLLLSATPYRMYTVADEADDHYADFVRTLKFLMHDEPAVVDRVGVLLDEYRTQLLASDDAEAIEAARDRLADALRTVMVRTERLAVSANRAEMLDPEPRCVTELQAGDVASFVALEGALRDIGSSRDGSPLQYWLSAPYLPNLMDDYKLKKRLREAATTAAGGAALARRWRGGRGLLPFDAVRANRPVDPGNAKLRTLTEQTVGGLWRLLWLPPSLPYYEGGPHFERARGSTKRLVFSSWRVAPRAIAALTSYEAERLQVSSSDKERRDRRLLDFNVARKTGRHAGMPVLALMYPCLALAGVDPLDLCRALAREGSGTTTLAEARGWARAKVAEFMRELPDPDDGPVDKRWYWAAPLLLDGQAAVDLLTTAELGSLSGSDDAGRWPEHVEYAQRVASGDLDPALGRRPEDLIDVLGDLALAGPGVVCLRALGRVLGGAPTWSSSRIRVDSMIAAWGLRALLNHPESISLVRASVKRGEYWRRALAYCVEGGLQAVLDEFAHLVFDLRAISRIDDMHERSTDLARAIQLAARGRSVQLAPDDVVVSGRRVEFKRHTMRTRFAMRYGEVETDGETTGDRTSAEVARDAFNSPFAPFVLASTSVGQEGLDFHAYCHAVVHWNLPSNPVDLEQREGRVHRYKGHAVRKNVVDAVGPRALHRDDPDPWAALFAEAEMSDEASQNSEIVPYWVFPGRARIERHVPALPLSREAEHLQRLQRTLALYRSVLGQPRQEELVQLLARRTLPAPLTYEDVRIDLSPAARE